VLRDVAHSQGALFIDVETRLEAAAPHGLLGDELFIEFVHPNLRGQQLIAAAVADALREAGIPRPSSDWHEPTADPAPEVLYASDPELKKREQQTRTLLCALARRPSCAAP
jgi:hypothetical protein